ncbi:MAG: TMEM175 family protein [Thermoanaerobaculia bacterium]
MSAVEEKETGRMEAFSDGVFAIAITLLISRSPSALAIYFMVAGRSR